MHVFHVYCAEKHSIKIKAQRRRRSRTVFYSLIAKVCSKMLLLVMFTRLEIGNDAG